MFLDQIEKLQKHGDYLLGQVSTCTTPEEIETLTRLALDCWNQARQIQWESQVESSLVYARWLIICGRTDWKFDEYVAFCGRNKLNPLSLEDFDEAMAQVFEGVKR